jgi:hypothetical protein
MTAVFPQAPEGWWSRCSVRSGRIVYRPSRRAAPSGRPVPFERRLDGADPGLAYPVTGSPLVKNFVRLTGPNGFVCSMDRFSVKGRRKTGPAQASYAATANRGGFSIATGSVVLHQAPTVVNDGATVQAGVPVANDVLANDTDAGGDGRTITAVTQPASGRVTITGARATVTDTPVAGASSAAPQTFSYTISDGRGGTATASVTATAKEMVTVTQDDYAVSRSLWNLAGTAGFNARVTITAGGTVIATATADARGAWAARPTVTIPTTATSVVVTSTQGGTATRAINRR